jgi:sigma-E factor negative regulatory protein RseB
MLLKSLFWEPFRALAQVNNAQAAIIFIAITVLGMPHFAHAQISIGASSANTQSNDTTLSINEWLLRMHEAAMKKRSYVGTLVQSSPQAISSARIWHACDGVQQMERVETLTGAPRSTFRRNNDVTTFMPEQKVVRIEKREQIGGFPELLQPGAGSIPEFYVVQAMGNERVAGLDADVVQLTPKDALRFGYRVWTEKKTNLVVKLQTLDASGAVLEQAAFSELQMDAPVKMDKLARMMAATEGYKVDQSPIAKTSSTNEGWGMKAPVPGFKSLSCYKRGNASPANPAVAATNAATNAATGASSAPSMVTSPLDGTTFQWIFSDGLATVSLFVEEFDKSRHTQEGLLAQGATHTLLRRMNEFWLTAVGEVPPQTLKAFARGLERKR